MKKYEILEHPAELRIRIYGKTIEELFENAALAMAQILSPATKFELKIKSEKLKVKSLDINSLLVDFLSEILAKSQIDKKVYKVKSLKLKVSKEGVNLRAEIVGSPIKRFEEDIKAVTYEDLNIKKINPPAGGWQTDLVFDI